MRKIKHGGRLLGCACMGLGLNGLMSPITRADVITPTSDFASSFYSNAQNPVNLINNSGMGEDGTVSTWTAQPDGSAVGMWHAGAGQGIGGAAPVVANQYVVFDLGGNYSLTSAYLWQMFQTGNLNRGIQNFQLFASSSAPSAADASNPPATYDLSGFTKILDTSTLTLSAFSSPTQTFTLSNATNVRSIYLDIISSYGYTNAPTNTTQYVGLSEIKFEGTAFAVPLFTWSNTAGGSGQTAGNWTAAGPPTATDDAAFNLNNTYTVTSGANAALRQMNVSAGNVTLSLGSTTLQADMINLSGGALTVPSLVKGPAAAGQIGFTTALNFTDGTLNVNGGAFKPNVSTGSFTIAGATNSSANPTLSLTNGATLSLTGASLLDGSITIGANGGKGTVNVDGTGSKMSTYTSSGALQIGNSGVVVAGTFYGADGSLNIINGGQATSAYPTFIGEYGGTGRVTIDGANSSLSVSSTVNGYLYVGYDVSSGQAANGTLTLTAGGTASAVKSAFIGAHGGTGSASVDGAGSTLSAANIEFGEYYGSGTLSVTNQGTITTPGTFYVGDMGAGHATVDGTGSQVTADSGIYVGDSVTSDNVRGDGVLTLTNGALAGSSYVVFVGTEGGRGTLNVGKSDGTDTGNTKVTTPYLEVGSGVSTADVNSIVNVYAGGTVNATTAVDTYTNAAAPANTRLNLLGGTIKTSALNTQDASQLNWTSGTIWLTGGNSTTNGTLTIPTAGTLKGSGSISGSVTSIGLISPGDNGTGTLSLNNGLTIGTSGDQGRFAADIDFGDSTADLLDVTGTVNLINAQLDLSLINPPSDITSPVTFLLINNDGIDPVIGQFASVDPATFSNFQYSINYAYNNGGTGLGNDVAITFTAVPEPGSAMLVLASSLGLLIRRRRSSDQSARQEIA